MTTMLPATPTPMAMCSFEPDPSSLVDPLALVLGLVGSVAIVDTDDGSPVVTVAPVEIDEGRSTGMRVGENVGTEAGGAVSVHVGG